MIEKLLPIVLSFKKIYTTDKFDLDLENDMVNSYVVSIYNNGSCHNKENHERNFRLLKIISLEVAMKNNEYILSKEWLELVFTAMQSERTKEEFQEFLKSKNEEINKKNL